MKPYQRRSQLPKAVKDSLPVHAQHIYMDAFNAAMSMNHGEEEAARIAWSAVEKSYKLDGDTGRWSHLHQRAAMELFSAEGAVLQGAGAKLFWKEVIPTGHYVHPEDTKENFDVDESRMQGWLDNFNAGNPNLVTVPVARVPGTPNHTSDALANAGFVLRGDNSGMEIRPNDKGGSSLWALMEITDPEIIPKVGTTIRGCSIRVGPYTNAEGKDMGEAIFHICLTNTPYIENTENFIEAEKGIANIAVFEIKEDLEVTDEGGENKLKVDIIKELATAMEAEGADVDVIFATFCEQQNLIPKPAEAPPAPEIPLSQITAEAKTAEAVEFEALPASVKAKLVEFEALKKKDADNAAATFIAEHREKISAACKAEAMILLTAGSKTSVEFEANQTDLRKVFESYVDKSPKCLDFESHAVPVMEKPPVGDGITAEMAVAEADRLITTYAPK